MRVKKDSMGGLREQYRVENKEEIIAPKYERRLVV